MTQILYWPTLLLLIAFGLFVLEFLIPSAGILGILAGSTLIAAIASAFLVGGMKVGAVYTLGAALLLPVLMYWLVHWWPKTPIGRRVLMTPPSAEDVLPTNRLQAPQWIGRQGTTLGPLLPSGSVRVEGQTLDARSEGGTIESGITVVVVAVRDNRLVVRTCKPTLDDTDDQRRTDVMISAELPAMIPDPFDDSLS